MFEATVLTFAIEPPTKPILVSAAATVDILLVGEICPATVLTLVISSATKSIFDVPGVSVTESVIEPLSIMWVKLLLKSWPTIFMLLMLVVIVSISSATLVILASLAATVVISPDIPATVVTSVALGVSLWKV